MVGPKRPKPEGATPHRGQVRRVLDRAVHSVVNGLMYARDGSARPSMGSVPKELVFQRGKLSLFRVRSIECSGRRS